MSHRGKSKASGDASQTNGSIVGKGKNKITKNNGHTNHEVVMSEKHRLRDEREKLKLWKRPVQTTKYFLLECLHLSREFSANLLRHKLGISILLLVVACVFVLDRYVPGEHQRVFEQVREQMFFIAYWVGLGVISSVGLGTGLHTFLIYLGPHIASVTLAAYECNSLNFPKPPYPDEIICPEDNDSKFVPSLWNIMSKVRYEAFLWGAGTALGELPPYFVAKAARLSGYDPDDAEDLKEFEELQKKREQGGNLTFIERGKLFMEKIVEKVGFFGILACASIPNPLFDLAGITCGHFLVPFVTFFGATLLGKAVIKMHIQKVFVIMAFNEPLIKKVMDKISFIPVIGEKLQGSFLNFLEAQKTKYHRDRRQKVAEKANYLAKGFEILVIAMVLYFVVSIVNAFAQNYYKRLNKKKTKGTSAKNKVSNKIAKD